jgi:phosphoadenosine phosphosulfate reductase
MTLTNATGLVDADFLISPADMLESGRPSQEELRELATRAGRELEGKPAEEIVRWAAETFGERFCVTSSMADAVLAHVVSRVMPGVDVLFLDTGLHFEETLRIRDTVARTLPVNVRSIRPRLSVGQQDGLYGPRLFARRPDECCALRKVEPLERALEPYDAWAAGLRRDESPTRANTPVVTYEASRGKVKVNPLAAWTQADVDGYIARYDVPVNPLIKQGYASIGCWPCTRRTKAGEDPRAGRWPMFDKTECGLHS